MAAAPVRASRCLMAFEPLWQRCKRERREEIPSAERPRQVAHQHGKFPRWQRILPVMTRSSAGTRLSSEASFECARYVIAVRRDLSSAAKRRKNPPSPESLLAKDASSCLPPGWREAP